MKTIIVSKKIVLAIAAILAIAVNISIAFAQNTAITAHTTPDIGGLISSLMSNPTALTIFAIQLVLGLALGYFSAKVFKYILALIVTFAVGILLNVWQLSSGQASLLSNISSQVKTLNTSWTELQPVVMSLVYQLGLTTVFPITVGFIVGLLIAFIK